MKKSIQKIVTGVLGVVMVLLLLSGCSGQEEKAGFSFGDDLVFTENEGIISIDLENSSELVIEKHKVLSEILTDKEVLEDIAVVSTTTAGILEASGIVPTGAPESQALSPTLREKQYTVSEVGGIDKERVLNIGSAISPNLEAIVELNPKLVLYSDAMPPMDFVGNLSQAGVNIAALPQSDYVDMFVLLDVLGNITDHQNESTNQMMNDMVDSLKEIDGIVAEGSGDEKPTVAILQVTEGVVQVRGNDSVLGRITDALGLDNAFADTPDVELNKEQLLTRDPDFIIYSSHGMGGDVIKGFEDELFAGDSIYRDLNAVKEGKAFQVASDDFVFAASVDFNIIKVIQYLAEKFYA